MRRLGLMMPSLMMLSLMMACAADDEVASTQSGCAGEACLAASADRAAGEELSSEELRRRRQRDSGAAIDSGASSVGVADAGAVADAGVVAEASVAAAPFSVASTTSQWVMGYYVGYQKDAYPLAEIDWSGLTHIVLAPLVVRADGSFDTTWLGFGSDADGIAFAKQLSAAAHAHGVKAVLMLGGAGLSDQVKPAMGANTAGFVSSLVSLNNRLGFDGIDLDVEASNFSLDDTIALAQGLRSAAPGMILSYPGGSIQLGQAVDPRLATLAKSLDRFNIQSYQGGSHGMFTGGNSVGKYFESWFYGALGGVSELRRYAIDHALAQLAAAGIPKAKLGMGVGFYAGCYRTPDTTVPGGADVNGPRMGAYAPSEWCWDCGVGGGDNTFPLSAFFAGSSLFGNSSESEQKWDAEAQEPYLSFAHAKAESRCGGSTRYVVYEDERSLIAKGAFSRAQGYGGIIVWTIQQGYLPANAAGGRARNALMQALRKGFIVP